MGSSLLVLDGKGPWCANIKRIWARIRCGGVTSKAVIIAHSMAMLVCSMSGVRPKVPGRKRGCLLVVVLVGTVSPSGSSGMVESL